MKKFNAIKILEEEKQTQDLFNRNLSKEDYMNNVYNYIETYIRPNLEKNLSKTNIPTPQEFIEEMKNEVLSYNNISDENKENMLNENTISTYYIHTLIEKLIVSATEIVNSLGLITEKPNIEENDDNIEQIDEEPFYNDIEDLSYMLQEDEIGFLRKDKKIKKQLATKISDYLIRKETYDINLNKYIEHYIVPKLIKYNCENKIKFDLNSTNKEILLISNNTIEVAKKIIFENTVMSDMFPFMKKDLNEEIVKYQDFLFNDNEESKIEFANFFFDFLLNDYEKIDFMNVEKFDRMKELENLLTLYIEDDEI